MKKPTLKPSAGKSETTLEEKALAHFSAGRYKEAADLFKDLLKHSDNAFHRQQLAQCYLYRASSMAAKGMPKEACILWENYADCAEQPLAALDSYILWQLSVKNTQKAYARLAQLTTQQLDENYPELTVWLGFLMVSGNADIAPYLPQDSSLLVHLNLVRDALDAYRSHHAERCDQTLQKLPFRSAFRDLRTLLKAQLASATSIEQSQTLLSKIPAQSPYRPIANALLAYTQNGSSFVKTMLSLDHNQRRTVAHAKGLSNKQLELLETLVKLKGQQTDKVHFSLAIQYRQLFGSEAAQAYCQGMLASYPSGHKDYLKHFAAKDRFEEYRIQALLCEKGKDSFDATFYWRRCIEILKNQNPENDKKIALILRRMAAIASLTEAAGLIIESLDYDADDRDSYLKILNFYDQTKPDPAKYQSWLENSLKRFPKDIDLLARAAKSAAAKKAFKKAAGYAQALLKIDPVNTLAKQLLFASHIAHARRLIKTEKYHLVAKEIQAAEQLTVDKSLRRQAELLRGFHVWAAEDKTLGLQLIVETLQKLNDDPINAQFQASMEASLLALPVTAISKALPSFKDHLLSAQQLTRLMALIKHYDEQIGERKALFKALDKIKAPVKNSIQQQNFSEALLLEWCRVLESIERFELLKHCVRLALGKWQKPIWIYYLTVSESHGDPGRLGITAMFRLQTALADARDENDQKTAFLIGRFIERGMGYQAPFGYDFEDDSYDDYEEGFDILDGLFGHLPESLMNKVMQRVQSMMMKTDPERFIGETIRKQGQKIGKKRLVALFDNPDFFSAVAILKAAEELRIDIGVSFEDIVHRFENDATPQQSLPFF